METALVSTRLKMNFIQHKFMVDTMCGRLSRWLRIMGYDTLWASERDRHRMIARCFKESRTLITRCFRYAKTKGLQTVILRTDQLSGQVHQLVEELHLILDKDRFFERCGFCNVIVETIDKNSVISAVPPYVYEVHQQFYRCPNCLRFYWNGTHKPHFEKQLAKMLETLPHPGPYPVDQKKKV